MTLFEMAEYRSLFASDEALGEFTKKLHDSIVKSGSSIVLGAKGEIVGAALSSDLMKQLISQRILKRLCTEPELVDKIYKRLEQDKIVD